MTTANQVMTKAHSYIGYVEKGDNITQFWARQKPAWQGQPWCAAFVDDVLEQCGNTLLKEVPSPFYTPSMESWAKKVDRWGVSKDGKACDVLIFGPDPGLAFHTGFLVRQDGPNHVITIEGNTSPGNGGSQTNGGGVYKRRRPRSFIRGCITIQDQFSENMPGIAVLTPAQGGIGEDGELGPQTIGALEKYLAPFLAEAPDGELGRGDVRAIQQWVGDVRTGKLTEENVKALQRKVSAYPDGEWGPRTTFGLQRFLNKRVRDLR